MKQNIRIPLESFAYSHDMMRKQMELLKRWNRSEDNETINFTLTKKSNEFFHVPFFFGDDTKRWHVMDLRNVNNIFTEYLLFSIIAQRFDLIKYAHSVTIYIKWVVLLFFFLPKKTPKKLERIKSNMKQAVDILQAVDTG